MHPCTAARFPFRFLSCQSFNPENLDSDNNYEYPPVIWQVDFPKSTGRCRDMNLDPQLPQQTPFSQQWQLSVNLFEPTPHREFFACRSNCKSRIKPCRMSVIVAIIGESSSILPIGVHHVDFYVSSPLRRESNAFTVGRP